MTKAWVIWIQQCSVCGLYWTNPIFRFYKMYDVLYDASGLTTAMPADNVLKKMLDNNFKGTDKNYEAFFRCLKELTAGSKLMEFGSSWGYFLYQAAQKGYDATGVEISKKRREFGGTRLKVNMVPDMRFLISQDRKFDVIVTFHVLEHLTNVSTIFEDFHSLLNNNGLLIINVPFIDPAQGLHTFKALGAVHPLGFSKAFFKQNLSNKGFDVDFQGDFILCKKNKK